MKSSRIYRVNLSLSMCVCVCENACLERGWRREDVWRCVFQLLPAKSPPSHTSVRLGERFVCFVFVFFQLASVCGCMHVCVCVCVCLYVQLALHCARALQKKNDQTTNNGAPPFRYQIVVGSFTRIADLCPPPPTPLWCVGEKGSRGRERVMVSGEYPWWWAAPAPPGVRLRYCSSDSSNSSR